MMRFAGRTVLVTGGASGIGQGIALAFAEQGANVAITFLTSDPLMDIRNTRDVTRVMRGGRLYSVTDLIKR